MLIRPSGVIVGIVLLTGAAVSTARAQKPPTVAIHPLGSVAAMAALKLRAIVQLRVLSDGRVLINDPGDRQVLLLDAKLSNPVIVLDSVAGRNRSYGMGTMLLPYYGDSSLVFDRVANAFVVVDPQGALGRVIAGPSGTLPTTAAARRGGPPPGRADGPPSTIVLPVAANLLMTFSPSFGILYSLRKSPIVQYPLADVARPLAGQPDIVRTFEDSAMVVNLNPATRQSDTLFKISTGNQVVRTLKAVGGNAVSPPSTFPFADEVAVMHDGSLAVFRSRDYHVDWVTPGKTIASPRVPYDWQPMTAALRAQIIDSVNTARKADYTDALTMMKRDSALIVAGLLATGRKVDSTTFQVPPVSVFDGTDLPDFLPATSRGAVIADADNHLWIRRNLTAGVPAKDAMAYDVVDRQGKVLERVRVPVGQTIMGFAPGFAYLVEKDAGVATLLKMKLK